MTYGTTKGALRLLAKSTAVHCAQTGLNIRCHAIHPGVIKTPPIRGVIEGAPDLQGADNLFTGISHMKRMGWLCQSKLRTGLITG